MHGATRVVRIVVAITSLAARGRAAGDYVCKALDVPGATLTQLSRMNNAGDVSAGSDRGGFVYSSSDGNWVPLPPGPGFAAADTAALGVNDLGAVTGSAIIAGRATGFILTGSTYSLFSYRPDTFANTEARAIGNDGVVIGDVVDPEGISGVSFIYNPAASPPFAPGFTEVVPALPDGTISSRSIAAGINDAGQFVGSADFPDGSRYGFLYDPAVAAQPITLFRIEGHRTAARGINSKGQVVGFVSTPEGTRGFILTAAGFELISCTDIAAGASVGVQSINDSGVITGSYGSHGFIGFPNVALPVTSVNGAFVFDVAVSPDTPVFLDPPAAVGYQYRTGTQDPPFTSVRLPIGIGDNVFTVIAGGRAFTLPAGRKLDFVASGFTGGIAAFEVLGIEPAANLDPASATAFVTELTFGAAGRFTGAMVPMSVADELADLLSAATALGPGKSLAAKVRNAQVAGGSGDVAGTCAALGDFLSEVAAQAEKKIPATAARVLSAEAEAARSALACQ